MRHLTAQGEASRLGTCACPASSVPSSACSARSPAWRARS